MKASKSYRDPWRLSFRYFLDNSGHGLHQHEVFQHKTIAILLNHAPNMILLNLNSLLFAAGMNPESDHTEQSAWLKTNFRAETPKYPGPCWRDRNFSALLPYLGFMSRLEKIAIGGEEIQNTLIEEILDSGIDHLFNK